MMEWQWWQQMEWESPLMQAPMAGPATPRFAAACAEAGMLGGLGAGYWTAEQLRAAIEAFRKRSDRPFQANLFIPGEDPVYSEEVEAARRALAPHYERFGLHVPEWEGRDSEYEEKLAVLAEERVPFVSFAFGLPEAASAQRLRDAGCFLIGTATSIDEAAAAEFLGCDAVVLQGKEAGGHRAAFLEDRLLPTIELVREADAEIGIPLIAAGGIASHRDVQRALEAGASAVQVGTALLASEESDAHPLHKQAILTARPGDTELTAAYTGKLARGVRTAFVEQMAGQPVAPYPVQRELTEPLCAAAAERGESGWMRLWAGEAAHSAQRGTVKELAVRLWPPLADENQM